MSVLLTDYRVRLAGLATVALLAASVAFATVAAQDAFADPPSVPVEGRANLRAMPQLPGATRQESGAQVHHDNRDSDADDLPQRLLSSLKTTLLRQAEELRIGPSITLLSQRRSGVDLSFGPGIRLPTRIVGYPDLWKHHSMPDMLLNASRKMSPVDNVTVSVESLFRGSRQTDFTEAVTWTRTVSRRWEGFVACSSPDSSDDSAEHGTAYRAVALGADVWPLRRLPIRLEGGISALPARLGVFFSVGFIPRHLPPTPPPVPVPPAAIVPQPE